MRLKIHVECLHGQWMNHRWRVGRRLFGIGGDVVPGVALRFGDVLADMAALSRAAGLQFRLVVHFPDVSCVHRRRRCAANGRRGRSERRRQSTTHGRNVSCGI